MASHAWTGLRLGHGLGSGLGSGLGWRLGPGSGLGLEGLPRLLLVHLLGCLWRALEARERHAVTRLAARLGASWVGGVGWVGHAQVQVQVQVQVQGVAMHGWRVCTCGRTGGSTKARFFFSASLAQSTMPSEAMPASFRALRLQMHTTEAPLTW